MGAWLRPCLHARLAGHTPVGGGAETTAATRAPREESCHEGPGGGRSATPPEPHVPCPRPPPTGSHSTATTSSRSFILRGQPALPGGGGRKPAAHLSPGLARPGPVATPLPSNRLPPASQWRASVILPGRKRRGRRRRRRQRSLGVGGGGFVARSRGLCGRALGAESLCPACRDAKQPVSSPPQGGGRAAVLWARSGAAAAETGKPLDVQQTLVCPNLLKKPWREPGRCRGSALTRRPGQQASSSVRGCLRRRRPSVVASPCPELETTFLSRLLAPSRRGRGTVG